jgi:hypothetical protein
MDLGARSLETLWTKWGRMGARPLEEKVSRLVEQTVISINENAGRYDQHFHLVSE